jgi:hypothetical protein
VPDIGCINPFLLLIGSSSSVHILSLTIPKEITRSRRWRVFSKSWLRLVHVVSLEYGRPQLYVEIQVENHMISALRKTKTKTGSPWCGETVLRKNYKTEIFVVTLRITTLITIPYFSCEANKYLSSSRTVRHFFNTLCFGLLKYNAY